MKKKLLKKKKKSIELTTTNKKTDDSEQDSSKSLLKQDDNIFDDIDEYNKPLSSYENLLDNYDIIQYKNIKIPRINITNNYNFDKFKKPFKEILEKINTDYLLTKDIIYYFSKLQSNKINKEKINENSISLNQNINTEFSNYKKLKNEDIIIDIENKNEDEENNRLNKNISNNKKDILNNIPFYEIKKKNQIVYSKKPKSFKKIFNLKFYDNNKNLICKKRGRRSLKNITHVHSALDDDNILRKIQVHFLTFLVSFTNDYIDAIFPNVDKKIIPHFRHIDYKLKKTINHESIKKMKTLVIGEILQKKASPKNKTCVNNINQIIYENLCEKNPELKQIYFNKLFKEFFIEYYYNKSERSIILNGVTVNLSDKTQSFNNLIQKNINFSEKFRKIASYFYMNNIDDKEEVQGEKTKEKEQSNISQKPFFIID